jgi:hypothetical protein
MKIDAVDWEYLTGKAQYVFELPRKVAIDHRDPGNIVETDGGPHDCLVNIKVSADAFVEVFAENAEKEEMHPLWSGTQVDLSIQTCGFSAIILKADKKTQIAVQTFKKIKGEKLDPTPLAMTMATEKDIPLKDAIRQFLREELAARGVDDIDPDDYDLDVFDGDFDDVIEESELSPHQVAEMRKEEERLRKSVEPSDDNEDDDESDPGDDQEQPEVEEEPDDGGT